MNLVAVYGTLKKGLCNHHLLQSARYLGNDVIHSLVLYDLGPYPGAKPESSQGIEIEVYLVSEATLADLDALEECNLQQPDQGMYRRDALPTRYGLAWVYVYNRSVQGCARLDQGAWLPQIA